MGILVLNGDRIVLNGATISLGQAAFIPLRRGDDAGPSPRERFWQQKAEEELEELLERAKEAVRRPVKARVAVADEFQLVEWEALPQARQIGEMLQALTAPQPDYTELAGLILAEMQRIEAARVKARRKRDVEAVMLLS